MHPKSALPAASTPSWADTIEANISGNGDDGEPIYTDTEIPTSTDCLQSLTLLKLSLISE
jgi:hypothetical protein